MTTAFRPAPLSILAASAFAALAPEAAKAEDHTVVGLGVAYAPAYQGADDDRVLPVPVIDIQRGRFFANLRDGVGADLLQGKAVTLGVAIAYVRGYRRRDAPLGVGKLSDGVGARAFANAMAGGFVATLGGTKVLSGGAEGVLIDASLSRPFQASSRLTLTPTLAATWADRKYNDRYFGVSALQSVRSGLPTFRPGAGVKDVSALITATYRLNDRVTLGATGGVTALAGKAKDSPIVAEKTQPMAFLSASYRF